MKLSKVFAALALAVSVAVVPASPIIARTTEAVVATEKKSFGLKKKDCFANSLTFFSYKVKLPTKATYKLDGKKLKKDLIYGDGYWIAFGKPLEEGKHTLKISQKGYKTFTFKWTYEVPKFDTIFAYDTYNIRNASGYGYDMALWKACNPALEGKITFKIDDVEATDYISFVNGDGVLVYVINLKDIAYGTHTLTASSEGFEDESMEFEYNQPIIEMVFYETGDGEEEPWTVVVLNPELQGETFSFEIDGEAAEAAYEPAIDEEDGSFLTIFRGKLPAGEHMLTVTVGDATETATFVVK